MLLTIRLDSDSQTLLIGLLEHVDCPATGAFYAPDHILGFEIKEALHVEFRLAHHAVEVVRVHCYLLLNSS